MCENPRPCIPERGVVPEKGERNAVAGREMDRKQKSSRFFCKPVPPLLQKGGSLSLFSFDFLYFFLVAERGG